MSSFSFPRQSGVLDSWGSQDVGPPRRSVPARVVRAVDEAVAVAHGRGIVQAARVRALEYVTHEALQALRELSELEAQHSRSTPASESRYRAITDAAAAALVTIVAETGRA